VTRMHKAGAATLTPALSRQRERGKPAVPIDIEELLVWAYRDQCVDRAAKGFSPKGPSASPSGSLGQYVALGTRVDGGSAAARAMGVRLPDDAAIIHDAVLALGDMWIEDLPDDGVAIWDRALVAAAGLRVGRCKATGLPVLEGEGEARLLRDVGLVGMIIPHARAATRPDHGGRPPRGRRAANDAPIDARGRRRAAADLIADMVRDRARYTCWRMALALLAAELDGMLAGFAPTGPIAPAEPWLDSATAAGNRSAGMRADACDGRGFQNSRTVQAVEIASETGGLTRRGA
jgi:hypothetical protein